MKRRNFIKSTALTGIGVALNACTKEIKEERIYTPNLIIGSGFGGSVTALRLAQAGHNSILIERGKTWNAAEFCSFTNVNEKSTWLNRKAMVPIVNLKLPIKEYLGVIEYHEYRNMNIFNAAGLGGGSLVFGATYVKPQQLPFERLFPSEVSYSEMDEIYYPKVQQEINFSHIPEDIYQSEYYLYARTFKQQVENAGKTSVRLPASYDWEIIRKEMRGEIPLEFLKGDGNYGTRNNSKYSLDKNYIARAIATNKTKVYTQTNVVQIKINSDKKYEVSTQQLNVWGTIVGLKTFICDKLFLCAGAPNTIKLLLKSKYTSNLKELNSNIGKGFGTNGKTFFRRTVDANTGALTGWTPAEASFHFDNPYVPIIIENIPQPLGLILPIPDLKSHFHVGLAATTYRANFEYDDATDKLMLDWNVNGLDESINAAKDWANIVNAANPNSYIDNLLIRNYYANNVSYHPLGGCVIGQATDFYGRVVEYPNLYVNDSTLIPGALCANPAYSIAALAERNIAKIVEQDFK
ncbi:MAG: GMC family oxidoreductase [Sphingobacteriales bacterium]|nr:MAG: GMC family oxidoreductase [Sphingobacteriales bacterium]